ncbi:MAG TPA: T9SS type A sorting domain-containing protein [Sphingobacterium sp.]|nr:T9SS type A sorting domain-containing protein [Sphingobacterium sp.]
MAVSVAFSSEAVEANHTFEVSSLIEGKDEDKGIADVKVFYNPVSSEISMTFNLKEQNDVVIKVMDALGSEVLDLMDAKLDKGMQNVSFDTGGKLESGIYFVRVSSGSETVVKRISIR